MGSKGSRLYPPTLLSIPAAIIAGMLDESPVLDEAGKNVFRDWVDVACLRADAPPLKLSRREKTDCVGCDKA